MKKANKKNRIVSGLLVFAMALGLLIFFGVNAPAQKVYAAENPKATADQVLLGSNTIASYGDNLPAGVSFEDGVLTIGEGYASLGIGVIVQTENYPYDCRYPHRSK